MRNIQKVKQLRNSIEEALHMYELEDVINYSSIKEKLAEVFDLA
jgi:hypothetical protein